MSSLTCFKAYDIRGKLGEELNEQIAYSIGRAFARVLKPALVAVGGDIRHSSDSLKLALSLGLLVEGVNVLDLGLTGTEEVYFAAQHLAIDGAIEVTASHNPIDYNGMKLVRAQSRPISGDSGLFAIRDEAQRLLVDAFEPALLARLTEQSSRLADDGGWQLGSASFRKYSILSPYIKHLLTYINGTNITPLNLVVNAGNGAAGHVVDALEQAFAEHNIPISLIKIHHQADGNFPNGIPNPLLVENRQATAEAVRHYQADFGIAWDGDFDRCFLFDEHGEFIEGYYIVGLLAAAFLKKYPGEKIIHDPRLYWNTQAVVSQHKGQTVCSKTGHAFIKERMRAEDAIYGGEMSAHHYFRDFAYCDSGMIPWLLVAELISVSGKRLSHLVKQMIIEYPSSGEINFSIASPQKVITKLAEHYASMALATDDIDGLSMSFGNWRFNVRVSNTENVVRLNVESKGDIQLMQQKTAELKSFLTEAE
ncbi:phosphomannomutase [Arsukibacterium ikkense]|uniref:phosphomannomutase n=2 Tax=Arsukibacterium ikkense TaxID=336831 RepID=A0A0M2V117_9GAMM|nr:phosphomannomutase/phosphoglucomutase [Arsukibacterium ikkense]KKO44054.1 phosphomannomutase [Arsukibacterium ikkense]